MAKDDEGTGTFTPDSGDDREYTYSVEYWVPINEPDDHREQITTGDLIAVDRMVVESHPTDDPEDKTYSTVWGPFDNWDVVEGFLAEDFSDSGSLFVLNRK